MKKLLTVVLCVLMLVSCFGLTASAKEETFKIGMMLPQTGYPGAAKAYQNGVTIAVEEINANGGILGREVEIVVEDMATTPDVALNALNKIAARGDINVIFGCALSSCALTIEYRLPEEKIILMSGATTPLLDEIDNDYFFRGRVSDEFNTRIAMSFLNTKMNVGEGSTIGMLYDSSDFGMNAFEVFKGLCEDQKINLVGEAFNADDTDVSTQVLKLKNAGVDAIVVWTASGFPVASRAIYEQGFECPVIASAAVSNASVLSTCTEWIENWYTITDICLDAPVPGLNEFVEKHNQRFDPKELSFDALTTYSWTYLFKEAIERAGSFDSDAIVAALNETNGFQGLNGIYTKFSNVEFLNNAIIAQIHSGVVNYIDRVEAPIA